MVKLIPGRIRHEGIQLYESGQLTVHSCQDRMLRASLEGEVLVYDLTLEDGTCTCAFFAKKTYCQHLAAMEYYLKQDKVGRTFLNDHRPNVQERSRHQSSMGKLFLVDLGLEDLSEPRYRLSVLGQKSPYSSTIWWQFKINRLPDRRTYLVKDIKSFLQVVKQQAAYQIGKNYYEKLYLEAFDQPSQDLISFLWDLIPTGDFVDLSFLFPENGRYLSLSPGSLAEGLQHMQALYGFRFENGKSYDQVFVENLTASHGLYQFDVSVYHQDIILTIKEAADYLTLSDRYLLQGNVFYQLSPKQARLIKQLQSLPLKADFSRKLYFDLLDQRQLALSLRDFKLLGQVKAPRAFEVRDFEAYFDFSLAANKDLVLQVTLDYGDYQVKSQADLNELPFTSNSRQEQALFQCLKAEGFPQAFHSRRQALRAEELYQFFEVSLKHFEQLGSVYLSEELESLRLTEPAHIVFDHQVGLLEVRFEFSQLSAEQVEAATQALLEHQAYFVTDRGQVLIFDEETRQISQTLQSLRLNRVGSGKLQLEGAASYQILSQLKEGDNLSFSDNLRQLAYDLAHPERFSLPDFPLEKQLRPYQRLGVQWLSMLYHHGFAGILADDMGLGKTLQTIAFLQANLRANQRVLIITPSSLMYNWQDEFVRFAPELDMAVAYGNKSQRLETIADQHQITITSYGSFRQDFEDYQNDAYDFLILDEAQVMKNSQTQIAQKLRAFEVRTCFALSGTPIENQLLEIWSLFEVVLPGLLPSRQAFKRLSAQEVAKQVQPFILRRRKAEVLQDLPAVVEKTYYNELSEDQKALYLAQLNQMKEDLSAVSEQNWQRRRMEILAGIIRLRQICDSPKLFMAFEGESGKLDSLRELLGQLRDSGRRPLIFSQFRVMLTLAETVLTDLGMTAYQLTGSTPALERQKMTRAFNKGSRDAFLISLKAGGVGLNLTGADTVVLIDLWWNPAVEEQAISRAHRLGQTAKVAVYRLITRGTIEERILALQASKKELITTVLDGADSRSSLSLEDIKLILGLVD